MGTKSGPKQSQATQQLAQVADMIGRGLSQREIAFALGISQASVSRMAAKLREQSTDDEPESGTLAHFLWRVERHKAELGI
jgi:predicted transcriptional regulator